ncbi:ABC transporter C family member 11 (ABC transporter ABCC.11) (AtABCC11) (ATP-energized glutathione S-conjugate pump 12) (Glutathione S-conjugate-transporting ATPase 12) (Multidrug resistance-associated protein 12) [Durusdinium trenchii]|uniref:Uncharacterized protein n=1 Tax=Durusdinium trenchii TaxID=1381693 RepID=A0ABP0RK86_9DINO
MPVHGRPVLVDPARTGDSRRHGDSGRVLITKWSSSSGGRKGNGDEWMRTMNRDVKVAWLDRLAGCELGKPLGGALGALAGDLPQVGGKEMQARECAAYFEQLWKEDRFLSEKPEVDRVGEFNASLARVIIKIYGIRTMFYLMFIMALQIIVSQVYSVYLVQKALGYFQWVQNFYHEHGILPDLREPLFVAMAVFSALPLSNIVLSSVNNHVPWHCAALWSGRLCGGLSLALFRKAQRLPCAKLTNETEGHDEEVNKATGGIVHMIQADLMTLTNYDVMTNMQGCYTWLCMCVNSTISIVVLMILLWKRLKMATFWAIAVAIPMVFLSMTMSAGLGHAMFRLQECMDKRISTLREILFGIRVVKCYAWEDAMQKLISGMRKEEVQTRVRSITRWYRFLGVFVGIFLTFPRLLILAGIWGYSAIYGHHDVATIFTCMQILSNLKNNCDMFTKSFGRVIVIRPSLLRIQNFLKMTEAPVLPPEKTPGWVSMWEQHPTAAPNLELKGSFRWGPETPPVLHELNLDMKRGHLIAVIGAVGSGKSTLMQAILGELYPVEDGTTHIARPEVIAYCSQIPHIAEGTLRENVIFGQKVDEERYRAALHAASLENDLKMFPAGDQVPIGSRGVALSGGQRARIAMARAAYHFSAELMLFDDPFGAVDAPTAMALLDRLLLGPMLRGKTRVVILQPDAERLRHFDQVVVLNQGRLVENGRPEEVMQTQAFQNLLQSAPSASGTFLDEGPSDAARAALSLARSTTPEGGPEENTSLRDEEAEGRPTVEMVNYYCKMGKWRNILNCCLLFFIQVYIYLLCDLVLATWTNKMARTPEMDDRPYLFGYLFWLILGTIFWVVCWMFGEWFTLQISAQIHGDVLKRILRAPIDRFFDKHPVGRIMNRLSADLSVVDLHLFMKATSTIAILYQTLIPLLYVHSVLPLAVTILAVPFYYLIWSFCVRYWNTTVPLRYCMSSARSDVNSLISDVMNNNVVIRAYRDQERISLEMCHALDNQLKAGLLGDRVLRRWLVNRVVFMWSFYTTTMYMVGILNANSIGVGTLGLCLTNLLLLESLIEPNLEAATGAQFEFIALARIHEYMSVPQENEMRTSGDQRYRSFCARISAKQLAGVKWAASERGRVFYTRSGTTLAVAMAIQVILQSNADGTALVPAFDGGKGPMPWIAVFEGRPTQFGELCPSNAELQQAEDWHKIVSVNDVVKDAKGMAQELCRHKITAVSFAGNQQVLVGVQSGWLYDGAQIKIENLRAGYGDLPRDVLKNISLTFDRRTKVGMVGTTGCGKSSFLLVLLRVLEPRGGRVLLNSVDTRDVGLATLREAMGLVPQDPVLFSGTLRHNLDPFEQYTEGRILEARGKAVGHVTVFSGKAGG